jgi:hypothetical protein
MNHSEKKLVEIKEKLQHIYNTLPNQMILDGTRMHIKNAINSISLVENKRNKRQENFTQNQNMLMFTSYDNAKTALNILDKMLDQEKQNLEQASKTTTTELLNG